MLDYLLIILFLAVVGFLSYYAYFLLINAGGSSLYNRILIVVSLTSLITLLNLLSLVNYKFNFINLNVNYRFYTNILMIVLTYNLFKVWEIKYNQVGKQNYQILVFILTILNLIIILLMKRDLIFVSDTKLISNLPIISNTLLLTLVTWLFYKDSMISKGSNFNYLHIVLFIILLTRIYQTVVSFESGLPLNYYLVLLIQNLAFLTIAKITHDDFKNSFYY